MGWGTAAEDQTTLLPVVCDIVKSLMLLTAKDALGIWGSPKPRVAGRKQVSS